MIGPVELLAIVVLLGILVGLVARAARALHATQVGVVGVAREWRLVRATRAIGLIGGLALAWVVFERGSYGSGPMLAPAVLGLCVLVAAAVGETVVRPPRPVGPRSASVRARRVVDYLPPVTTRLVAGLTGLTAATMVLTTLTSGYDEYTHGMRALVCQAGSFSSARTPYPGSYYTLPLAGLLVIVLAVAVIAAHQVVRRPRGMARTEEGDDALRRGSLRVIVAATGIAVSAPAVGIASTAGWAMKGLADQQPSCAPAWMGPTGTALLVLALVALVVACWCLALLLSGSQTRPAPVGDATGTGRVTR